MGLNIVCTCNGLAADIHCKDMAKLKMVITNYLDRLCEFGIYKNSHGKDVWFHIALKVSDVPYRFFIRDVS